MADMTTFLFMVLALFLPLPACGDDLDDDPPQLAGWPDRW